jgi:hypothetical protein
LQFFEKHRSAFYTFQGFVRIAFLCSTQSRARRISLLMSAAALFIHAETPLERGEYLVENAAMCGDCHTPMLKGKPDATLGFQPIGEVPGWHKTSPDISSSSQLLGR